MKQNKDQTRAETEAQIKAAGGIVHKDGTIFFANYQAFIAAARASAQQGVPEGWRLVPKRPTQSMCDAAKFYVDGRLSVFKWADGYYAMLSAAPQPVEQKGEQ